MQAHGLPLAYGGLPHEHIAFIGCHDNLTMFDFVSHCYHHMFRSHRTALPLEQCWATHRSVAEAQ